MAFTEVVRLIRDLCVTDEPCLLAEQCSAVNWTDKCHVMLFVTEKQCFNVKTGQALQS